MKKVLAITGVVLLLSVSIAVNAQETPKTPETTTPATWDPKKNATVQSLTAGFEGKMVAAPQALSTEKIYPALGKYESSANADAPAVTISLDEQNKGIVWIEGLPQGKVKAFLRKSPSTYKIPAQKTEDGKEVAEGTLIYDKETNNLSICIGKAYNMADPAAVFLPEPEPVTETAAVKSKSVKSKKVAEPKAWMYVGTKVAADKETVLN